MDGTFKIVPPNASDRDSWLDAIRSIAILLVVFCHGLNFFPQSPALVHLMYFCGFFGVELFFVLSGFLVGGILYEHFIGPTPLRSWLPNFWVRRWLRTIPNYYLFLIICVVFEYTYFQQGIPDARLHVFFLQNFAWAPPRLFLHSWSLTIEEFFYLVMPLLLAFTMIVARRWSRQKQILVACFTIIGASLVLRTAAATIPDPPLPFNVGIREVTIYRLDSLVIGMLVYWLYKKLGKPRAGAALAIGIFFVGLTTLALIGTFGNLDQSVFWKIWWCPLASVGCAGLLLAGLNRYAFPPLLAVPTLAIAKWSYSMYLSNSLVVMSLLAWGPRNETRTGFDYPFVHFAVYVAITLVVSRSVYVYFEVPILRSRELISNLLTKKAPLRSLASSRR